MHMAMKMIVTECKYATYIGSPFRSTMILIWEKKCFPRFETERHEDVPISKLADFDMGTERNLPVSKQTNTRITI